MADDAKDSKMGLMIGAIGLLSFVLFVAIFSISMGVFSSSNVKHVPQKDEEHHDQADDEYTDADLYGDFHSSYYDFEYDDLSSPADSAEVDSNKTMSREDSLAQMKWYEKQKREIADAWDKIKKERRSLEKERTDLENLNLETVRLLEQRRNIEDANTIQMAKLFDSMKGQEVADIMKNMTDERVGTILMRMKKQNASDVLAAIPPERAARITTLMINLAEGH